MADLDPNRPADAGNIAYLIGQLERLEAAGKLNAAEGQVLSQLRAKQAAAQQTIGETNATYRGAASGALLGAKDELSGAINALQGGSYAQARDETRALDKAAQTAFPRQYNRGRTAGTVATAAVPGVGALKATQGMGLMARMGIGGVTGALTAGGQGFAEGEGGFLPRIQNAAPSAGIGALFGAGAPAAGATAGGLMRLLRDGRRSIPGLSARATNAVVRPLSRSQASGTDVQAYLDSLGPEGMLADVPGNLRKTAQGLASMPGEGGEILTDALNLRAQGATNRIVSDVDATLGQADAAFDARRAQALERSSRLGPMYDAALSARAPVNLGGVSEVLQNGQADAASRVSAQLRKIEGDLGIKSKGGEVSVPDDVSALKLHNVRSDLSDDIEEARRNGRGKFVNAMQPVLDAIDEELNSVPGYIAARTGYANNKAIDDAIDAGRQVFRGGEASAMSPRQLEQELAALPDAQRDAFRKGAREWIDGLMGTSRNDAAAAWGAFEKGWNDEKLRSLLGDKQAERIRDRLKSDKVFSQTRGDGLMGSQTQMRNEAAGSLADLRMPDGGQRPGPIRRGLNAVNEAGNSIVDRILYAGRQDVNKQVGGLMTMQGEARDALVQNLLREAMLRQTPSAAEKAIRGPLDLLIRSAGAGVAAQ